MSDEIWFWVEEGERKGPSSPVEVKRLLSEGTLSAATLVWREGMPSWLPLRETELSVERISPPSLLDSDAPVLPPGETGELIPIRTAKLRTDYRPQFWNLLGRSWTQFASNFWPYVGFCALTTLILSFAMQFWIPILFLLYPIVTGYSFYVLLRIRGRQASIDELFVGFKKPFKQLALLNLVLSIPFAFLFVLLAVTITTVFLIGGTAEPDLTVLFGSIGIWGILFIAVVTAVQVVGNFACLLIVDCGCGWRQALSLGWEATRRHLVKHLLVFFFLGVLSYSGMIALYFGVFITSAWAWIAMIFLYEDAFGDAPDTGD